MTPPVLLVTERLSASPRSLFALEHAHALDGRRADPFSVAVATLSPEPGDGDHLLESIGVDLLRLGIGGAATLELALAGACLASGASTLLIWEAPRALSTLLALRELPSPPRITTHLPPLGTSWWDEAEIVATRSGNLIDRYLVEDHRTAELLRGLGVRSERIAVTTPSCTIGPLATDGRVFVVYGASWDRSETTARSLTRRLRTELEVTCAPCRFSGLFTMILRGSSPARAVRSSRAVFVERKLGSAAAFSALRRMGWEVLAPAGPLAEPFAEDPGFVALEGHPDDWLDQIVGARLHV